MLIFVKTLCILVEINVHIYHFASKNYSHILSFVNSKEVMKEIFDDFLKLHFHSVFVFQAYKIFSKYFSLLACQFLATNMWSTTYFPLLSSELFYSKEGVTMYFLIHYGHFSNKIAL